MFVELSEKQIVSVLRALREHDSYLLAQQQRMLNLGEESKAGAIASRRDELCAIGEQIDESLQSYNYK